MWTAPAQLPPGLSPLLALPYVCSSDLTKRPTSRHLYKAEIEWDSSIRRVPEEAIERVKAMLFFFFHSIDVSPSVSDSCEADEKASELASSAPTRSCGAGIT